MLKLALIAAGGGAGALCRYAISGVGQRIAGGAFPVGTLAANLIGCGLIGFLASLFAGPLLVRPEVRLAVLVGFLGGLTTFSSYGYETFTLANEGSFWRAGANVLLNNVLGFCGVWLGYRLAQAIYGG